MASKEGGDAENARRRREDHAASEGPDIQGPVEGSRRTVAEDVEALMNGSKVVGNVADACPDEPNEHARVKGQLVFDADFECGNLGRVDTVSPFEYDLFIRPDTCNAKYLVWFNFTVRNTKLNQIVVFNVVNQSKVKSLYRHGMAPVVRSTSRPDWMRMPGNQVFYYKCADHHDHYVMTFNFQFDKEEDTFYFAYCFPYTYTDLQGFLGQLDALSMPYFRREQLASTVQGRRLDLLTITSPANLLPSMDGTARRKRIRTVVVTARVHPGESPSSWVCEGLIHFLLSDSAQARSLRENMIFYVIPMLNPDGVFLGNYRCSVLGFDLNRCWSDVNSEVWEHPTIDAVREFVRKLNKDPTKCVSYVFDLHSHTALSDAFIYGNEYENDPGRTEMQSNFPKKLKLRCADFSLEKTGYNSYAYKVGTARRYLGDLYAHLCAYTVEISCYGYIDGETDEVIGYTPETYAEFGINLAKTFSDVSRQQG